MRMLGRKTLKSERARMRRIDAFFERVGYLLLIGFFMFTMSAWASYRESIRIKGVEVAGAHSTDEHDVINVASGYLSEKLLWRIDRNNSLLYPRKEMAAAIFGLDTHIEDVDLSVTKDRKLHVEIKEYTPSILWCSGEGDTTESSSTERCYLADKNGYVFAPAPNYSGYPFMVFRTPIAGSDENGSPVGLKLLSGEEFEKLSVVSSMLGTKGISVHEVRQIDSHDYDLSSDRPWVVRFSTEKDATTTVNNLILVLNGISNDKKATTTPKIIDLRFGNKIFYK